VINREQLIEDIRWEIKDSSGQWTERIARKLDQALRDIIRVHPWSWAVRSVLPDVIPVGTPPRIILPSDFNGLIDDGVIPVFTINRGYGWNSVGRVIHDTWADSVSDWPYYGNNWAGQNNFLNNNSGYGLDSYPSGPWYNRVAVSPDAALHFLYDTKHPYRINYISLPDLSRWPDEFAHLITSEVAARMQIPLEGQDLLTSKAEFALARAALQSLIEADSARDSGPQRVMSKRERLRKKAGILLNVPTAIIEQVVVPTVVRVNPTVATAGNIATLTGTDINKIVDFKINGQNTTLTLVSASEATFTVPQLQTGSYTTEFSYLGGASLVSGPTLSVAGVAGVPTIFSLSGADWNPATATASTLSEIKLTGVGLAAVTEFRAGNILLEVDNLGTASPSVYFPNTPGPYSLIGISPGGNTPVFRINVAAYPVVAVPQPTIADILFDGEGNNGRSRAQPLVENGYYPAGMPSSFNFKFYVGPIGQDIAGQIAGRGVQTAGSSYNQITQHSFPRYESRHTRVECGPAVTQYFSKSQQKWILIESFNFRGAAFSENFVANVATAADQFAYPDGTYSFRAGTNARGEAGTLQPVQIQFAEPGTLQNVGYNLHAFDFRYTINWADVECILLTQPMRAVGPGANATIPAYIANVGIDTWKDRTSGFDGFVTHGGLSGGRYKTVTADWQNFTNFVGPISRLTTNSPIGYAGGAVVDAPTLVAVSPNAGIRAGDTVNITGTNLDRITEYRIGTTVVTPAGTGTTNRALVIPAITPGTYTLTGIYAAGTVTSPSFVIVPALAPPGSIPTITGFSGADWNAGAASASQLSELTVLGINLNVITGFRIGGAGGLLLASDNLGTAAPRIILPAAAGQQNIVAEY
jgi:hypothetical protein